MRINKTLQVNSMINRVIPLQSSWSRNPVTKSGEKGRVEKERMRRQDIEEEKREWKV